MSIRNNVLLEVRGLVREFREGRNSRRVLNGIDLLIGKGESVALLGPSGSGKSTLLNLLAGIDQPDSGEIRINGHDICRMRERDRTLFRRTNIGFIYQFFNLIPTLTIGENIGLPLELNKTPEAEIESRVEALLDQIGLTDRVDSLPDQLSGGEQQRVAVARALIHRPGLLLADEPTGNLDIETGRSILELLMGLSFEHRPTLVLVTHNLEAARMADRLLELTAGKIAELADEHP